MSIGTPCLPRPPAGRRLAVLDTFIAGLAARATPPALAGLRAGAPLSLRRPDGARSGATLPVEVCTLDGLPLGLLPADDARTLDELALPGAPMSALVSAVVPAYQRPRVQLRIAFALAGEGDADEVPVIV